MSIQQAYEEMDFSQFSQVKETLRQRIHEKINQTPTLFGIRRELEWEELDQLAAAGRPMRKEDSDTNEDAKGCM